MLFAGCHRLMGVVNAHQCTIWVRRQCARDDGGGAIGVGLRGGGGAFRGRRWYLRKDFFVGSLQLSDLTRPHVAKLPLDSLLQRGDMLLYLALPPVSGLE